MPSDPSVPAAGTVSERAFFLFYLRGESSAGGMVTVYADRRAPRVPSRRLVLRTVETEHPIGRAEGGKRTEAVERCMGSRQERYPLGLFGLSSGLETTWTL